MTLWCYTNLFIIIIITKPQAGKLGYTYKIMLATAIYSLPWCCGKKPNFLFAEPWKSVGKGILSPECLL